MTNYYSVLADAVSRPRNNSENARRAIYECAGQALQEKLRTLDPPISQIVLANEQVALNTAICRVEEDFYVRKEHTLVGSADLSPG
jgi:hypothetical protein